MIALAYGLPGMGKSLLLHDMVARDAGRQRFFICDHENGWWEGSIHWRGKPPKNIRLIQNEEDLEALFDEDYEYWLEENETGLWVFQHCEPSRIVELTVRVGDSVFVDDEIDTSARKKGWDGGPLRDVVHQGRHQPNDFGDYCQNHILGACRRPQNLHNDISELASHLFVFRVKGKNTLGRLLDDDTIEEQQWDEIRTLPKFRYWDAPRSENDFRGSFASLAPIGGAPKPQGAKPSKEQRTKPNIPDSKFVNR